MPRLSRVVRCLVATLMVAAMLPHESLAQLTRGTVSGTIRDTSGASLPGATIVITNNATGVARTVLSDAAGFYRARPWSLGPTP